MTPRLTTHEIRLGVDGRELASGGRTGIGRYVTEVLRAASRSGWECLLYSDRALPEALVPGGVAVRILPPRVTQWWDQVSLPRQLARDRVAVFLSPYYKAPLGARCPVVVTVHDLFFIGYPGRRRPVYDRAARALARLYAARASAIIADSEHSRRELVRRLGVDAGRVRVIPVALAPHFAPMAANGAAARRYGITRPYVLYVGNFQPHKNVGRLIRAYAALDAATRRRHQLVLAGPDVERRAALEALARGLDVDADVVFPGAVDDAELPALYSGCSAFVMPSLEEGFGLPALEAMACGAPVIAADRGALPEVLGKAAWLVDPEDIGAIAGAIETVLARAETAEALRSRGLARARDFPPEATSERVLDLLREVVAPRREGSD